MASLPYGEKDGVWTLSEEEDPKCEGACRSLDPVPRDIGDRRDALPTRTVVSQGLAASCRLQIWGAKTQTLMSSSSLDASQMKSNDVKEEMGGGDVKRSRSCVFM